MSKLFADIRARVEAASKYESKGREDVFDWTEVEALLEAIDVMHSALCEIKALGTDATYKENGEWVNGGFASHGDSILDAALNTVRALSANASGEGGYK